VDSLGRERLTTETLEERIAKMARQYGADEVWEGAESQKGRKERKPGITRKKGF